MEKPIFFGAKPHTEWLDRCVERRDRYVVTGLEVPPGGWALDRQPLLLETSLPGVFAVGGVRYGSVKRVASAIGEGRLRRRHSCRSKSTGVDFRRRSSTETGRGGAGDAA